MRIWMTRPGEDAAAAAELLSQRGHRVHCAPLMRIVLPARRRLALDGVQAFLATSANGVRALIHHRGDAATFGIAIMCVGEATAQAARLAGFARVERAEGDVASLAALIRETLSPHAGALVHMAGDVRAGDLRDLLAAHGFDVRVEVLYHAQAATSLDAASRALLENHALDAVLLYSPRTALIYGELIAAAGLVAAAGRLVHLCLSPAVAAALGRLDLDAAQLRVAPEPTQAALFARLEG
jgi:uroporphyrinogen-III synthase